MAFVQTVNLDGASDHGLLSRVDRLSFIGVACKCKLCSTTCS